MQMRLFLMSIPTSDLSICLMTESTLEWFLIEVDRPLMIIPMPSLFKSLVAIPAVIWSLLQVNCILVHFSRTNGTECLYTVPAFVGFFFVCCLFVSK